MKEHAGENALEASVKMRKMNFSASSLHVSMWILIALSKPLSLASMTIVEVATRSVLEQSSLWRRLD